MKIIKTLLLAGATLLGVGCNSGTEAQTPENVVVSWNDELNYKFLDDDDADTKQALKAAKKTGSFDDYYARFRLGNLCFIEGETPAPAHVMDASGKHGFVGVLLSKAPQTVALPNQELARQFLKALRPDPEALSAERRYRALSILVGTNTPLSKMDMDDNNIIQARKIESRDPVWKDKNGTLEIDYYTLRSNGMMAPIPVECKITLDASDAFDLACAEVLMK